MIRLNETHVQITINNENKRGHTETKETETKQSRETGNKGNRTEYQIRVHRTKQNHYTEVCEDDFFLGELIF